MSQIELLLPKMGESVAEATIIRWLKKEGDTVKADEPIIEIATDKVDSEVPSPEDGILTACLVKENEVVLVGQPIAVISSSVSSAQAAVPAASTAVPSAVKADPVAINAAPASSPSVVSSDNRFYSPLVKNIAREENISQAELDAISGSGQGGRVTKNDILNYVRNRGTLKPASQEAPKPQMEARTEIAKPSSTSVIAIGPHDEIIEMDRMRKLIAEHMVMSKQTSPHVTSYVEVDVTHIVLWRERVKKAFEAKEKTKITYTPIFIEALVKAIKDFPMINVSVDGDKIIKRGEINMGRAAALPSGNLIVPVIRNADTLNLAGLARKVNDLADRARNNKLSPDEISGGTYTITNVGTFGNVMGTPIINQPQVAIMAVGAIRKKPAVLETPAGDVIAVRHMMFMSHSYDHRVVDGALGGQFVRRVADYLEAWDLNREI